MNTVANELMTVSDLRRLAKETEITGKTGLLIAGAKKEDLIVAINTGVWPLCTQTPSPYTPEPPAQQQAGEGGLGQVLADAIRGHLNLENLIRPSVTEEQVKEWVIESRDSMLSEEKLRNWVEAVTPKPTRIEVQMPTGEIKDMGLQHELFPKLLKLAAAGIHTWLTGPAGSGKTTICKHIAKALDKKFYPVSVCKQTTKSDLMGYMDVNGKYVESDVYRAVVNGDLLLVDEVDGGNANVNMSLNAVLANGVANFPCGVVEVHPNFVCFAGANTMGYGATREYVGRNPLDAAFLDRFGAKVKFGYDEEMEKALTSNTEWARYVQACRKAAKELGIKVVISPRSTISGSKMLAAGFSREETEDMALWNEMGLENAKRIKEKVKESL